MRYTELDALRGLAAVEVVFGHFLNIFPMMFENTYNTDQTGIYHLMNVLKYSPLHIVYSGHEAVMLFFILSGFVLSLPFYSGKVEYNKFLLKRICRIYLPYIAAILFSFLCYKLFSRGGIPELSWWFNSSWVVPVKLGDLISHVLLVGYFDTSLLNNVIWSLVHEIRISIIFPFIMILILRFGWKKSIIVVGTISFIAELVNNNIAVPGSAYSNILITVQLLILFVIGAVLAQNRVYLINWFRNLNRYICVGIFIIAILIYTHAAYFQGMPFIYSLLHNKIIPNEWIIALGASMLIIIVLSYNRLMLIRPLQFLGKISYSLYLLHFPTFFSIMYLFYGRFPIRVIYCISLVIAIILAYLSYKFIEAPAIELGKKLTLQKKVTPSYQVAE